MMPELDRKHYEPLIPVGGYASVYVDRKGEWRWRRVAGNGETVGNGEGYENRSDCIRMAMRLFPTVPVLENE